MVSQKGSIHTTGTPEEDIERLQRQQIIVPLDMDEASEWCNNFVLVPKVNGKVKLCLDPAELNKELIRTVHRVPKLNDILLRLAGIKYLTLIGTSAGYHNLKIKSHHT